MSPLLLHGNTNQYDINGLLCTYTEMFLEVVVFAIQFFFSPKYPLRQRSESNNIGDWL